ncbi:sugar transferase [Nocardia sp. GP40]
MPRRPRRLPQATPRPADTRRREISLPTTQHGNTGPAAVRAHLLTLCGHSYGSTTVCEAGAGGHLAGEIDQVILTGSPGAGSMSHASEFGIGDNVYVFSSYRDWLTYLGAATPGSRGRVFSRGLGPDPATEAWGAIRVDAETPRNPEFRHQMAIHQGYNAFAAADSEEQTVPLHNQALIVSGAAHLATRAEHHPNRLDPARRQRILTLPHDPERSRKASVASTAPDDGTAWSGADLRAEFADLIDAPALIPRIGRTDGTGLSPEARTTSPRRNPDPSALHPDGIPVGPLLLRHSPEGDRGDTRPGTGSNDGGHGGLPGSLQSVPDVDELRSLLLQYPSFWYFADLPQAPPGALVGPEWLASEERRRWYRHRFMMRAPIYALSAAAILAELELERLLGMPNVPYGPRLFHQQRLLLPGEEFPVSKFPTMPAGTPESPSSRDSAARSNPGGRLLRRTSGDELPQVKQIWDGQMDYMAARPNIPIETELMRQYLTEQEYNLFIQIPRRGLFTPHFPGERALEPHSPEFMLTRFWADVLFHKTAWRGWEEQYLRKVVGPFLRHEGVAAIRAYPADFRNAYHDRERRGHQTSPS